MCQPMNGNLDCSLVTRYLCVVTWHIVRGNLDCAWYLFTCAG